MEYGSQKVLYSVTKQPTGSYSNQNIALIFSEDEAVLLSVQDIHGCIQKFQDNTCKKKFAYLGC
jgi:hypothetical protein